MLLHDNSNIFFVSLQAVVSFHYQVKCTNSIFCVKCICIMADSDKTLIGDGNLSNNNRKSSVPNFVPPSSEIVHPETHPTHVATSEPSTLKRKQTSFQITSVTVKGSRLSTDGGEDSADDLDESHTEDANSDILDCSRTTDVDNDQLSEDNSNTNNDDTSNLAPSIPVKCKTELLIKHDAQTNATMNFPSETSKSEKPSEASENIESDHMVNPPTLPDQWQHRFRVVKIVSSEPFKRGRWLCMDFMDPPAPAVEVKPEVYDSTSGVNPQSISSTFPDVVPSDRVAHIYEISPSDAYPGSISVAVGPDQNQQPMYGIFLPVNHSQYPLITGMYSRAMPVQIETKRQEAPQSATSSSNGMQQPQNYTPGQTVYTDQQSVPCPQTQVIPTQQSHQSISNVQACTQNQSQTTIKASSMPTTTQPPTSTSTVPITTSSSATITSQPSLPPQSQMTQDSQLTMQQRIQTTTVQGQAVSSSGTQNVSSVSMVKPTLISSNSQISNASQVYVTSASSMQPQVHPVTNVSSAQSQIQQNTSISSVQTQVSQGTSALSSQPQMQQANAVPSNQPQIQQINVSSAPHVTNVTSVQPQVLVANVSSAQPQVQHVANATSVQAPIQQVGGTTTVQPQVQHVSNATAVQPQVQHAASVPSVQSQVQHAASAPSAQSQMQQVINVTSTPSQGPLVNNVPSAQTQTQQINSMPSTLTSSIGTQISSSTNIPEASTTSAIMQQEAVTVPSQVIQNHSEAQELGTPPANNQATQEMSSESVPSKSDINGEDSESAPSGTSTVAIDNKIEQAMDLVKSHLMFAVREEVDVLKEKITELMDRISQLEYENGFLRANASQQTLEQLNQSQLLQQQQQTQSSTISMNSFSQVTQQSVSQQQLNVQNQQSTS
ncbi:TSC22 domain family protein 2-like [Uloborus diversus]|uniref:TSC22 domain family protein 2-like n=1 Tax=Uloborus diversus TaxID=327109 RepID=UPI0024092556|nr:TSC22 domain family protein 2-like [Uloborus diversus]